MARRRGVMRERENWATSLWGVSVPALTGGAYNGKPTTTHISRFSSKYGTGETSRISPKIIQAVLVTMLAGFVSDIHYERHALGRVAARVKSLSDATKWYSLTIDATDDDRWVMGGFNADEDTGGVRPSYHSALLVLVARWASAQAGRRDPAGDEVLDRWDAALSAATLVYSPARPGSGWRGEALEALCTRPTLEAASARRALDGLADSLYVTTAFRCLTPDPATGDHPRRDVLIQVAPAYPALDPVALRPIDLLTPAVSPLTAGVGLGVAIGHGLAGSSGPSLSDPDAALDLSAAGVPAPDPDAVPNPDDAVPNPDDAVATATAIVESAGAPVLVETADTRRILRALRSPRPAMLVGPRASGKTELLKRVGNDPAHFDGYVYLRGSERMQAEDIYGSTIMDEKGRLVFTFGPMTMTAGAERVAAGARILFAFEELARAHGSIPNEVMAFADTHGATDVLRMGLTSPDEPGPYHVLFVPGYRTFVLPARRVKIVATANIGSSYHGLALDDAAFRDRFPLWLEVKPFDENELRAILSTRLGLRREDALVAALLHVWREVATFDAAQGNILAETPSPRSLIAWGEETMAQVEAGGTLAEEFALVAKYTWVDKSCPREGDHLDADVRAALLAHVAAATAAHLGGGRRRGRR